MSIDPKGAAPEIVASDGDSAKFKEALQDAFDHVRKFLGTPSGNKAFLLLPNGSDESYTKIKQVERTRH